jgi:hypothetical protein
MSAIDDYRRADQFFDQFEKPYIDEEKADAAIAELEAENLSLIQKTGEIAGGYEAALQQAEAALTDRQEAYQALHKRWVQAEAELAALKAAAENLTSLSSAVWSDEALAAVRELERLL